MAGERVLVIDSHTGQLKAEAEQVLSPHGFRLLWARGQDEGVKTALAESPHLLLVHLPLDSSICLLRSLAQAGCLAPSILIVDQESAQITLELLRLGVRDYVLYPFVAEEVLEAVQRVLIQEARSLDYPRVGGKITVANVELEQRVKECNVLLEIGRSVSWSLDLELVLNRAAEAAVFITGAEEGHVLLLDEESGELRLRAAQNFGEKQAQALSLRVRDSVAGMVVSTGKPVMLGGHAAQNLKVKTSNVVKSLLNVPLKADGRVIGVLGVDNRVSDAAFNRTHLRRLSALADMVAAAVENARRYTDLYEKFTRRAREFATLQAVADLMNVMTDFDVGARLALSLALKATNAEAGVLVWTEGKDKRPTFYVSQGSLGELIVTQRRGSAPTCWWDEQTLQRVIETGQPILMDDLGHRGNGNNSNARSRLVVPMRRGKTMTGAINLESSSPHAFTQDDLQFVLSVSDQVAIALETTMLQEKAEIGQERLALLMEAVDNAVWVLDADLRLMAQNEAASKMLGWSSSEAIGRSIVDLASPHHSSADGLCQLLSQAIEEGRPVSFPQGRATQTGGGPGVPRGDLRTDGNGVLLGTKDGRSILVKGRGMPLVRDGQVVGAVCAFREILSEKSAEHLRFEFVNMASHLLRSPLSFIQASIDILLNSELDAEEQRSMLDKMCEQSQRIREFIKDLLEISRLEISSVLVYPEPVALAPLIERVLDLIRPEEPCHVFSFTAPDAFPIVAADPGKTELILLNLLRSAIGRCPNGGCITLELKASTSEAIISIADDGEAIPLKQLERIFSQFYPVNDDGDKMPSTYQLGLYTTKRLIELQNGRVWAESQADKGTRLSFSLPVWG